MPYGAMADKHGRRLVLCLAISGLVVAQILEIATCWFSDTIPIRLICLAGLATFIGGGPMVINAMIFTMVGDVFTANQRLADPVPYEYYNGSWENRTTAFFYLGAAMTVVELISGPLTYLLMKRGDWFCVFTGLAGLCLANILALLLPESRDANTLRKHTPTSRQPESHQQQTGSGFFELLSKLPNAAATCIMAATNFVSNNAHSTLLLVGVAFGTLGQDVIILLQQYMTKRFGLSWARASLLLSIKGVAALAVTTTILPLTSQLLSRKLSLSPVHKDVWMARASATFLLLGAFCLGLAPTLETFLSSLVIFTVGIGYNLILCSLIASYAKDDKTGLMFTEIPVSEGLGGLIAGPIMAMLFRVGLNLGRAWIGLPFLFAGLLFSTSTLIVFLVPVTS
ncbi:Major facilitator superfamily, partial [Metarhizium majus ARSEF 297]